MRRCRPSLRQSPRVAPRSKALVKCCLMVAFALFFFHKFRRKLQLKFFLIDQNDRKCKKIAKLDRDFHKFLALLGLTTQHYGHRHRSKMLTKRALPRVSGARAARRPTRPGMGAARAKSQRDRPLRALNRGTGAPGVGDVSTPSNPNRKRRRTQEEVHGAVRTRPASGRLTAALKTPRVMTSRALPSPCKPALATVERGSRQLTDEERTQSSRLAQSASRALLGR